MRFTHQFQVCCFLKWTMYCGFALFTASQLSLEMAIRAFFFSVGKWKGERLFLNWIWFLIATQSWTRARLVSWTLFNHIGIYVLQAQNISKNCTWLSIIQTFVVVTNDRHAIRKYKVLCKWSKRNCPVDYKAKILRSNIIFIPYDLLMFSTISDRLIELS